MSYQLPDPLKESYERYKQDSAALHDMAADIALMRALIEKTVQANADNPERSLKAVEGSLAVLLKLERRLMELDILRNQVLHKSAIVEFGQRIVALLSDAIAKHAPDARDLIVDDVAPKLAIAITDARNSDE